ncbi:MAG: ChaN family lipoprotein [Planctomycetota bacterium]
MATRRTPVFLVLTLLAACAASPAGDAPPQELPAELADVDYRVLDTRSGRAVSVAEAADALAAADVVFLGELHDNDVGHRLQQELTEALLARRGSLVLSLEMFERDVQPVLDAYLAGDIDEEGFLADSRPWPNYAEHYRPAVEFARSRDLPVLASNVPRPLAARVVREGLRRVMTADHTPRLAVTPPGEYRDRFDAVMGTHGGLDGIAPDNVFAAQCIKDDAMAESIVDTLAAAGSDAPLVVHWCGRFHSDFELGTVERVRLRLPDARLAVVSMEPGEDLDRELGDEERTRGDYVLRVP